MRNKITAVLSLCLGLAAAQQLSAQAAAISPWINTQFTDQTGKVLAGGYVYTCIAASSCPGTPQTTFNSSSGFTQNQNPIPLDAAGRASIWLTPGLSYRFVVTNHTGTVIPGAGADNVMGSITVLPAQLTPGGPTNSIQYNNGSSMLAGTANLTWTPGTQVLGITGIQGQASVTSYAGYFQSYNGFVSSVAGGGSWQGFNTNTDGALMRGYSLIQSTSNMAGGYIDITPITYNPYNGGTCMDSFGNVVQQPLPLNGLSGFGPNDALIWVGKSPIMPSGGSCGAPLPVVTTYSVNTNSSIFARGGYSTDIAAFNSFQSLNGGASFKLGVTMGQANYFATQTSCAALNPPAATYGGFGGWLGATNYCYWNGTIWTPIDLSMSGGGGGSPGSPTTSVQFNNGGVFTGSTNMVWNNAGRLLTITALDSAHPGVAIAGGFAQTDAGFYATVGVATSYQTFNAPSGGAYVKSLTALNYTGVGTSNGVPALTAGQSGFPAGSQYCDTPSPGVTPCVPKLYDGTGWITLATGGATPPGGGATDVQFSNGTTFAGSSNLTYASQQLTSIALNSGSPAFVGAVGFMQAENGFLAQQISAPLTALPWNVIQAPTGGIFALSMTSKNYTQLGAYNSGGVGTPPPLTLGASGFSQGAAAYDTNGSSGGVGGVLRIFDGANWNPVGGAGGTPGLPSASVQYNNGTTFAGSANMLWDNLNQHLIVTGIGTTPGITLLHGAYFESLGATGGFNAPTSTQYNAIQAPAGGGFAKNFDATVYIKVGSWSSASTPTPVLTGADGLAPGLMSWDTNGGSLKVYNGSAMVALALGGVSSLNTLTGGLTIAGTTNEITVTPVGSTITLATPQAIAATSAVNFASVGTTSFIASSASGAALAFQAGGGTFQVLGNGTTSMTGVLSVNGAAGGVNVTAHPGFDAYQTVGGGNFCDAGTCTSGRAISVAGSTVINSAGQFVGGGVNTTTGVFSSAVTMNGGLVTLTGTNSTLFIGTGGNFYNRIVSGASTGISCSGISNGWAAVTTTDNYLVVCDNGGTRYRAALVAY